MIPETHWTGERGVNEVRTFFTNNRCVVTSPYGHDIGKDLYVDLTNDGQPSGAFIAVQVKAGESYRDAGGGYSFRVENHGVLWRNSTVPVIAVVYDPVAEKMFWVDATSQLRSDPSATRIKFQDSDELISSTIPQLINIANRHGATLTGLVSRHEEIQIQAVFDCLALGRSDGDAFALLRAVLVRLTPNAVKAAVSVLTHLTPHPDIFWTKDNWIPVNVKKRMMGELQWSTDEIVRMLHSTEDEDWCRGGAGQSVFMLLVQDSNIEKKLESVVVELSKCGDTKNAYRALVCLVEQSSVNTVQKIEDLIAIEPAVEVLDNVPELIEILREYGTASFM